MMKTRFGWRGLAALALVAALAGAARAGEQRDQVILKDENAGIMEGVIISENHTTVEFQEQGGEKRSIPQSEIREVVYNDTPDSFNLAREALDNGDPEHARLLFTAATRETTVRPWIRRYCGYYEGICLLEEARRQGEAAAYRKAIDRLERLNQDYPDNRFRLEAQLAVVEALVDQGNLERLEIYISSVGQGFGAADRSGYRLFAEGRLAEARQKLPAAAERFQKAAAWARAEATADPLLAAHARAKRAQCLLASGDTAGARQELVPLNRDLVDRLEIPGPIRAVALNGLGDVERLAQNWEEALLAYLRVDLMFSQDARLRAHARLNAGRCLAQLGRRGDARRYFEKVIEDYPNSEWSRAAEQERARLP